MPAQLSGDREAKDGIDLMKYCELRQWPLLRNQFKAIDDFFEGRRKVGYMQSSDSPIQDLPSV